MNPVPAHPIGLNDSKPPGKSWPAGPNPPDEGWSRYRWLALIALIFTAHLAAVFVFGEHKRVPPRPVTHVPALKLIDHADELLALTDPTLFALPHEQDFGSAIWLQSPLVAAPSFRWTEKPRWLAMSGRSLGVAFTSFMQTNPFNSYPLNFKPAPQLRIPALVNLPMTGQNSSLQVRGDLASRLLIAPLNLTNWPNADVIAPSVVQVVVDASGTVISTALLPPGGSFAPTDQYDPADQRALEIARTLRFKPAPQLTVGQVIFNWQTIPVPTVTVPPATSL